MPRVASFVSGPFGLLRRACRLTALAIWACMLACTASPQPRTPDPREDPLAYRTCEGEGSCGARAECIEGLCVAGCAGAVACRDASACWEGECRDTCDAAHPCGLGYRCTEEGACAYDPCGSMALYPHSLRSASFPVLVHYRDPVEEAAAREALAATEEAWRIETQDMGWDPPLSDEGRCGPDASLDVFVWRTYRGCVSDVVGEVDSTPHDDRANYLIVDPWGPYGGEHLRATVAHELSHAMQAAHDWNEAPIAFEMSAQFVESLFAPDEPTWFEYFGDYQRHADWSFDRDDGYETFYMYGSALYLHFLREQVFEGEAAERFLSQVWRECRSVAGHNEPDLFDALESVLQARAGISFEESLIRFTRARYYTGSRSTSPSARACMTTGAFPYTSSAPTGSRPNKARSSWACTTCASAQRRSSSRATPAFASTCRRCPAWRPAATAT